jgi:pimeloyl-ACP methyl ester carboxylesterase
VGQDWGGAIAWLIACYYPELVERLVVLACPHPSAYRDPELCDQEQMSRQTYVLKFQALGLGCSWLSHGDFQELERWMTAAPHGALRAGAITSKDVERYKAAFSRPGSLAGAMSYYKASLAANTKWWDETAEK